MVLKTNFCVVFLVAACDQFYCTFNHVEINNVLRLTSNNVWASTQDLVHIASASSEGSDKPGHMHSLTRALTAPIHKVQTT